MLILRKYTLAVNMQKKEVNFNRFWKTVQGRCHVIWLAQWKVHGSEDNIRVD